MRIIIPGNPVSKNRPRFARVGRGVRTYSNQKKEENVFTIKVLKAVKYASLSSSSSPSSIQLIVFFYLKRPKSHYGTGRNLGKLKKSAPVIHSKKPDIDNLLKFVMDCMNGILWKDDSQVFSVTAVKEYSDYPRTEITWGGI